MRIVGAALLELSRVPADQISINQVIQNAGISRGSFYQYFESKEDLIGYILSDFKNRLREGLQFHLEKSGGNIFRMAEAIYCDIIRMGENEKNRKIIRNFLLGTKLSKNDRKSFWQLFGVKEDFLTELLSPYMDTSRLRSSEPDFLANVSDMLFLVMIQSVTEAFFDYDHAGRYQRDFDIRLDIIRQGAAEPEHS